MYWADWGLADLRRTRFDVSCQGYAQCGVLLLVVLERHLHQDGLLASNRGRACWESPAHLVVPEHPSEAVASGPAPAKKGMSGACRI